MKDKEKLIKELEYKIKFEKLISSVCARFINVRIENIDHEISASIKEVARFIGADSGFVFQFEEYGHKMYQTHEWSVKKDLSVYVPKTIDIEDFPWWYDQICRVAYLYIQDVQDLPEAAKLEREFFISKGYRTLVNIPLIRATVLTGFLSFATFEEVKNYSEETLDLLRIICEIILSSIERKKAEASKRLLEERFEKAFNACPDAMAIISVDDGCFIDVNDSLAKTIGHKKEDIVGQKFTEMDMDVSSQFTKLENLLIKEDKIRNLKIAARTREGEIRTGLISAEPIFLEGQKYYLTVIRDLTDSVKIKDEMSRLERLTLVSKLAAGVSHEIRNPMTTVRGFLQMLGAKEENRWCSEFFDIMIEELDRANCIITEFLTLGRNQSISANEMSDIKKTNLNAVIQTLYPLLYADAMNDGKSILLDLTDIDEIAVKNNDMRQLILNMVRNGLEAMSPGGKVTILTFKQKNRVVLEIKDEGKGIQPEVMKRIGTPFFTTKEKGTGLGLTVCYSIAAKYDAQINVQSSHEGTSFQIIFNPDLKADKTKEIMVL